MYDKVNALSLLKKSIETALSRINDLSEGDMEVNLICLSDILIGCDVST